MIFFSLFSFFFFFNDTATTEIYTLSLHDALPICRHTSGLLALAVMTKSDLEETLNPLFERIRDRPLDRKSTRLNSSHSQISYAVFCLKKKKRYKHHLLADTTNS